jgi:hypothetical protein
MRVDRDGTTFIEDVNAFGQEWQVLEEEEEKLFHNYDETIVKAPAKCILLPTITAQSTILRQRRLSASDLTVDKAEAACAHVNGEGERKACVYNGFAIQDINMAGAW